MFVCSIKRDLVTLCLFVGAIGQTAHAQGPYVSGAGGTGRVALVESGRAAPIVVDPGDFAGVRRAAADLSADIARVSSVEPALSGTMPSGGGARQVVIVGTIGRGGLIDDLVREHKVDVHGVAGRWESFVTQVVNAPAPGVDRALVIAGSDKRGTIYGIYDLSSEIGVSPWTWWADVPPRHSDQLYVLPGRRASGEPAVKYRGIFLNDEAPALSGFAREKFGGFNHQFYAKVFELILRLRGNYLWPAMWGNAFNDDDPEDAALADEYGIVMGTSHHEPMLRAQQEWKRYGKGDWNYATNDSLLHAFWTQGIRNMGSHESIVTIGMRGDGDKPMTDNGSDVALLERIVADQRSIIAKVSGRDASKTPQLWALYKEVQDYYDKGMRVPDDVTLLFSDDNWGNIRRLPSARDTSRSGGFGIYYHFDYVGGPRNYKWINTNPIARVWEQMHLAYEHGARRIWIVNVGDLKPMEYPISFFLDYAWNPARWPAERLPEYARAWAAQQFGDAHAREIADVMTTSLKYAGRRKPELLDTATYSLTNFREAETVVAQYDSLRTRARRISAALPAEARDAFFELVLHPIEAAANLDELYVTVAKNRLYAREGRATTNDLADSARKLFDRDAELARYYNTQLAGGKWPHMMDQTHIGYTYWQEPPRNTMPRVDVIQLPVKADMGVAIVEQNRPPLTRNPFGRAGAPAIMQANREPALAVFDRYRQPTYHLDVYNRGSTPFEFTAKASEPWLSVTPSSGRIDKEQRLSVSVGWSEGVPVGSSRATITITGPGGTTYTLHASIENPAAPDRASFNGFVESSGYVSMDAEDYTRAIYGGVTWLSVPDLGRVGSAMTPMPVTAASQTPGGSSPHLEYRMFLFDTGAVTTHVFLSPTLNFTGSAAGLRYAVSFDDQAPQIVNVQADTSTRTWEGFVANNVIESVRSHTIGAGGVHVLKLWMVDPGVVFQKIVVEAKPASLPDSYLGPPESFRGPVRPAPAARFDWFEYSGHDSASKRFKPSPSQYVNPVVAGFYPDPSIVRAGDAYYLVNSSFVYFPGVPIFRSTDLVHWSQIGNVLDRPSQLSVEGAGISRGIYAPTIRYHDGTFYLITTLVDRGGNFIVTAANPAGPWSDPIWLRDVDGIDPSLFFDDDGHAYVVNNGPPIGTPLYDGHRAIWIQEYDVAARAMKGPRSVIVNGGVDLSKKPIWIEAPHIFKVNGRYYLICAEGGTAEQHSEVVFRADKPTGPYSPFAGNPILTQRHLPDDRPDPITSTGHADFVQTPAGDWWAVFLGTRPYTGELYNIGRETFLMAVKWEDGWPRIVGGTDPLPPVIGRPALPASSSAIPMSGDFTVKDDFDAHTLAPYWMFMRTVDERWYDLDSVPGSLVIHARHEAIQDRGHPSFIGRRQQHISATASTAVHFVPDRPGDLAGLVAFQNETHNYVLAVARTADTTVVQLEMRNGTAVPDSVIARIPVRLSPRDPVELRIDARGGRYDFYYAQRHGAWRPVARDADGTILSSKKAGGFVGTVIGMYAYAAAR
jgi:beta-xylosidase